MLTIAHGLAGRADLPLPRGMFLFGATAVLVVSFVALAVLWSRPTLQDSQPRRTLGRLGRVFTHPAAEAVCGAVGLTLLGLCLWSALWGTWPADSNFAMVFVFVVFWVGLIPVTVVFGNVYAAFNPWRAIGRLSGWWLTRLDGRSEALPYPDRLGYWPAAAGLFAFGWLELAHTSSAPALGIAILVYTGVQLLGMSLFGVDAWTRQGDAFAVWFGLLGRVSPFARHGRDIVLRRPLTALTSWPTGAGATAVLLVLIGTVSFDGAREGPVFQWALPGLLNFWGEWTASPSAPIELSAATGLVAAIALVTILYWLGTRGAAGHDRPPDSMRRSFAHTLVPIAIAYAGAHYFSLLMYTGQRLWSSASDPLGRGWDLFGTAGTQVDYSVVSTEQIWWVMLTLVLGGHVVALALAHDRALVVFDGLRAAVRSQLSLLAAMVGFTLLALYLLHTLATSA